MLLELLTNDNYVEMIIKSIFTSEMSKSCSFFFGYNNFNNILHVKRKGWGKISEIFALI